MKEKLQHPGRYIYLQMLPVVMPPWVTPFYISQCSRASCDGAAAAQRCSPRAMGDTRRRETEVKTCN